MKRHPLCRPPAGVVKVKRFDHVRRRWVNDDGKRGEVFVGFMNAADEQDPNGTSYVWVAECACTKHNECPLARGLRYAADQYGGCTTIARSPR